MLYKLFVYGVLVSFFYQPLYAQSGDFKITGQIDGMKKGKLILPFIMMLITPGIPLRLQTASFLFQEVSGNLFSL